MRAPSRPLVRAAWSLLFAGALVAQGSKGLPALAQGAAGTPAHRTASAERLQPADVSLDGTPLGPIALQRAGQTAIVALEPLATKLGWHVVPLQGGIRVQNEDRTLLLTIGARTIRDNGDLRAMFNEAPFERSGHVYLAAGDAARLFGLKLTTAGGVLSFARPPELGTETKIVEVARPSTPRPVPTKTPHLPPQITSASYPSIGRVMLSLDKTGPIGLVHLESQTSTAYVHTNFDSSGVNEFGMPTGTVTFGSKAQNLTMGLVSDPISGIIMRGGLYDGVDFYQAKEQRDLFAGHRLDNGTSSVGVSLGSPLSSSGSNTMEIYTKDGGYDETILRHFVRQHHPWGDFSQELLLGDRGFGIGYDARTRGRTYLESTVSYATQGLPLGPNDAPITLDVGRDLSSSTSVAGGFYTGPHQRIGPFLGLQTHGKSFAAAVSLTNTTATFSLAYQTPTANLQVFSIPGIQRETGLQGTLLLPGAIFDAEAQSSPGTREASIEMHTVRRGINFITGIGYPAPGHLGPIVGVSLPVGKMLAVEGSLRPSSTAAATFRISLAAAIGARRPPAPPTVPIVVQILGSPPPTPLRVFLDGAPTRQFTGDTLALKTTKGQHVVAAESADATLGSPDQTVTIAAAGDTVQLTLWPERAVSGHVVLDRTAVAPSDFTLGNIIVTIEPGDVTTVTADDGSFVFAKQPLPPNATIAVDASSLPRELRAPDAVPVGDAPLELRLLPGLKIEREHF